MKKFFFILLLICSSVVRAEELNRTLSPDATREAYTSGGNLFVRDVVSKEVTQLTFDGSYTILNGRASWVYYEEIFGRASEYRAFWWSPDSKKIAYYHFDETKVTLFPIFSPFGQDGNLKTARYPKAGEVNPEVKIAIVDIEGGETSWADFKNEDQYFGTPFWGADSNTLYVQRQPRRQNFLELYAVSASDGTKSLVYKEYHLTWVDWIEGMLFNDKGIYMVRDSETGWQQIYFLTYDGKHCTRLTEGRNWGVELLKESGGKVWFVARRDNILHPSVYRLEKKNIYQLTPPEFWARNVQIIGTTLEAELSTAATPWRRCIYNANSKSPKLISEYLSNEISTGVPIAEPIRIQNDGFDLYGLISYPKDFDSLKTYPVIMEVYGGPGTAYVRDRWRDRDATDEWAWNNGVIWMCVDPRSSGENGRRGLDEAFGRMTVMELQDYIAWAKHMATLPYVDASRIGVDGFSFGGTTTAMLVLRYPEYFRCGIAGGGVYDWTLYDSNYTERFMMTPKLNPVGYKDASVLECVRGGGVSENYRPYSLKLTHGTGDDNVHFQNTLQLIDVLQKKGVKFDLMIYPDGMHGYRGFQRTHDKADAAAFWTENLLK